MNVANPNHPLDLSIIIVNWNTRDLLAQCLTSVYAHPPSGPFEVIVVDNASSDGSAAMVRERFPNLILIENSENVGFAQGNNQALRVARGRHALLLNSDTVALPETINVLLNALEEFPQAGFVGPTLLNPDGSFQASYADFPTLIGETMALFGIAKLLWGSQYPSYGPRDSQVTQSVDWVGGACLMVRRSCWEEIGLLDESIIMYGEEVDWCYRAKIAGWKTIHCPDSRLIHFGGMSSANLSGWKYLHIQYGKVYFFRKHGRPLIAGLLSSLIKLISLIKVASLSILLLFDNDDRSTIRSRIEKHRYLVDNLI